MNILVPICSAPQLPHPSPPYLDPIKFHLYPYKQLITMKSCSLKKKDCIYCYITCSYMYTGKKPSKRLKLCCNISNKSYIRSEGIDLNFARYS